MGSKSLCAAVSLPESPEVETPSVKKFQQLEPRSTRSTSVAMFSRGKSPTRSITSM